MAPWWRSWRSPIPATRFSELDLLVVDVETTGLDPRRDHVIEVGWIPVRLGEVVLDGVRGTPVHLPDGVEVGESAVVHGLTDDELETAPSLSDVMHELRAALEGKILVAHHAPIETGFLRDALPVGNGDRSPLVVDTMLLQRRLLVHGHGEPPRGALRLDAARRRFGLPQYAAHRAATDAAATAELLLAQVAEIGSRLGREPTLRDLSPHRLGR